MSKKAGLKPVADEPGDKPTLAGYPVTIELPTGGRYDVDALLREMCRPAFGPALRGYRFDATDGRPRAWVTCLTLSTFGPAEHKQATQRIQDALVALGVLKIAKPVEEKTDECPPQSPQES